MASETRTCACMEVFGEDPNCIKHGRGTEWAKAHPDLCDLAERAASDRAAVAELVEALRKIAEGNLGDMPWQANYDRIRVVASEALSRHQAGLGKGDERG